MRTLHVGLQVSDLERSLAFYTAVGYTVVKTVEGTASGSLTMLRLPGDGFVTIKLVHDPAAEEDSVELLQLTGPALTSGRPPALAVLQAAADAASQQAVTNPVYQPASPGDDPPASSHA